MGKVAFFCRVNDGGSRRHDWKEGEPMEAILAEHLEAFLNAGFQGRLRTQAVCLAEDAEIELELRKMMEQGEPMPRIALPYHEKTKRGTAKGQSPWRMYFEPHYRNDRIRYEKRKLEINSVDSELRNVQNKIIAEKRDNKKTRSQESDLSRELEKKKEDFNILRNTIERPLEEGKDFNIKGKGQVLKRATNAILLREARAKAELKRMGF